MARSDGIYNHTDVTTSVRVCTYVDVKDKENREGKPSE